MLVSTEKPDLAEKVRFLSTGAHLGEPGVNIQTIETHFAWVFLTSQYAFKLRKPVRHHGLDTLGLDSRRARCDEELRLNRMLAPDVYLDVLPLAVSPDGRMRLIGAGEAVDRSMVPPDWGTDSQIVDWLLRMRRLPAARMLDHMIRERSWTPADLQAVSAHLQAFYRGSPALPMTGDEYCHRLGAAVRDNREMLLAAASFGVDASRVATIASLQERLIETHRKSLMQRAEQGMVRDCHGDLKPEHVYCGPPVRVIDRLEFDADLRLLDPIEDLCFLWLECSRLGAASAGEWLVRRHIAVAGDKAPWPLAELYLSLRALTRSKLAAWRLIEPGSDRVHWRERVSDYLARALNAARRAEPGPRH